MSFEGMLHILNEMTPETRVGIVAHTRPDGDAVGSVLGLATVLLEANIDAIPLLSDQYYVPKTYQWLQNFDAYSTPDQQKDKAFDYLFVLDTPSISRLSLGEQFLAQAQSVLLIDHHPRHDIPATLACVDTTASATAQLIWRLVEASRFEVSQAAAEACFVGLVTDTGSFQHSNTDAVALKEASAMVARGARPFEVSTKVFNNKTCAALELESCVMQRLTLANNDKVAYSIISHDDYVRLGAQKAEGENLVDIVRSVGGIEVALLITADPSGPRISLRSKTDFDVSAVAQQIGGGGHRAAAGCKWPHSDTPLVEVIAEVLSMLPGAQEG